jgi:hypothetical protein
LASYNLHLVRSAFSLLTFAVWKLLLVTVQNGFFTLYNNLGNHKLFLKIIIHIKKNLLINNNNKFQASFSFEKEISCNLFNKTFSYIIYKITFFQSCKIQYYLAVNYLMHFSERAYLISFERLNEGWCALIFPTF